MGQSTVKRLGRRHRRLGHRDREPCSGARRGSGGPDWRPPCALPSRTPHRPQPGAHHSCTPPLPWLSPPPAGQPSGICQGAGGGGRRRRAHHRRRARCARFLCAAAGGCTGRGAGRGAGHNGRDCSCVLVLHGHWCSPVPVLHGHCSPVKALLPHPAGASPPPRPPVPPHMQRQALLDAAKLAGLNVMGLIHSHAGGWRGGAGCMLVAGGLGPGGAADVEQPTYMYAPSIDAFTAAVGFTSTSPFTWLAPLHLQPLPCSTASSATSPTAPKRSCCTTWVPPACRWRWSPTAHTPTPRWVPWGGGLVRV